MMLNEIVPPSLLRLLRWLAQRPHAEAEEQSAAGNLRRCLEQPAVAALLQQGPRATRAEDEARQERMRWEARASR